MMKKFLKILLIVVLTIAVLVAAIFGMFSYFIYKNVDKYMLSLNCSGYMTHLGIFEAHLLDPEKSKQELGFHNEMAVKMTGLIQQMYVMGRLGMEYPGQKDDMLKLMDEPHYVKYLNELSSICTAYPELEAKTLLNENEKDLEKMLNHELLEGMLKDLKIEERPVNRALGSMYGSEMQTKLRSAAMIEAMQKQVSATAAISATVEGQ